MTLDFTVYEHFQIAASLTVRVSRSSLECHERARLTCLLGWRDLPSTIGCKQIVEVSLVSILVVVHLRMFSSYIETGGEGALIRPWVWVSWLFIGPVFGSLLFNYHNYVAVRKVPFPCQSSTYLTNN